ncbi:hypothetical protein PoB_001930000 [Plakobranchus ocellatus]|uniref:Uncharacterized protein n=1 Tax=Plakobranchus ocellatus TaxID=259542 RepID=A0AAV3ZB85_9GAST|nr:hypothetical protein PoB_001930000 [Plakobranchus ocellatus]
MARSVHHLLPSFLWFKKSLHSFWYLILHFYFFLPSHSSPPPPSIPPFIVSSPYPSILKPQSKKKNAQNFCSTTLSHGAGPALRDFPLLGKGPHSIDALGVSPRFSSESPYEWLACEDHRATGRCLDRARSMMGETPLQPLQPLQGLGTHRNCHHQQPTESLLSEPPPLLPLLLQQLAFASTRLLLLASIDAGDVQVYEISKDKDGCIGNSNLYL